MPVLLLFNLSGRILVPANRQGLTADPTDSLEDSLSELEAAWRASLYGSEPEALMVVKHYWRWHPRLHLVSGMGETELLDLLRPRDVQSYEVTDHKHMHLAHCTGPGALDFWKTSVAPPLWPPTGTLPPDWWQRLSGTQDLPAMIRYLMKRRLEDMIGQTRAQLIPLVRPSSRQD